MAVHVSRRQAEQLQLGLEPGSHVANPPRRRRPKEESDRMSSVAKLAGRGWVSYRYAGGRHVWTHHDGRAVEGATYSQAIDAALCCDEKSHITSQGAVKL